MLAIGRSELEKKRLGIYYTPARLAQTLVEWAIRRADDTILEPSFGGCNFLVASHDRLLSLGCDDPLQQICGTDIDKHALDSLGRAFGMLDVKNRFLLSDFLSTTPSEFCIQQFDVVVGNPPYVSHHAIPPGQKGRAWTLADGWGWELQRTASLWAYFVLHSLSFCKEGGRLAFVLPQSFLLANYSVVVRQALEASFEIVEIRDLRNRMFQDQGTNERSVLLLASGFRGAARIPAGTAPRARRVVSERPLRTHYMTLDGGAAVAFRAAAASSVLLGECVDLRIGTVTGANLVFVVDGETVEASALPDEALLPALAKIPAVHGLAYTDDDHVRAVKEGKRCYLIRPDSKSLNRQPLSIRRYFSSIPAETVEANSTFKKRPFWFAIDDIREPDAFLSYMHHEAPTLIVNTLRAVCTNNIHRVWWKDHVTQRHKKLISISFLCTFTQLSAELEGRTYGGGVLKHELGEARNIRLLLPKSLMDSDVDAAHIEADRYLRKGQKARATAAADELLLTGTYGARDLRRMTASLVGALAIMRDRRTAR